MAHLLHDEEPIIAHCTPIGSGAIALLRLEGIGSFDIAQKMAKLASSAKITELPSHTIHLGWILDAQGQRIDNVMFLLMRAPRTYTGQDVVEITCHNNLFIVEQIIDRAIACGARLAEGGEFTKRAVLNKKIDLVQAEAVNELIHAQTQMALKKSLAQLEGSLSGYMVELENELLKALALCQASFEFIDEEMEFGETIAQLVKKVLQTIAQLKTSFAKQDHIRQGIRVALLGSVNAGKSSLFNAVLDKSRAIVSPLAGTTRDSIEAGISKDGNYWTLVDTAGLRHTNDTIEQEGIKRSWQEAQKADIILLIIDASRTMTDNEEQIYKKLYADYERKTILVYNKTDVAISPYPLAILASQKIIASCQANQGIIEIENAIKNKVEELFAAIESPYLLTKRQYNLLLSLEQKLAAIEKTLTETIHYELLSIHLSDAIESVAELTGKSVSEAGMDKVFQEFCVGK